MIPAIENLPRVRLGLFPTPLVEARHLSAALNGPRIFIKREDLCGLALGGNKCRKLEFILGEAKKQGADAVISTAGSQSNFCVELAAAARKLGMKPSFVVTRGPHTETQGNLLLHNILDSDVEVVDTPDRSEAFIEGSSISKRMEKLADDLRSRGNKPFIARHAVPDISAIVGTVGWVNGADELITQLKDQNIDAQYVVVAVGLGTIHAGLALGAKYLGANYKTVGICISWQKEHTVASIMTFIDAMSDFLGLGVKVTPDEFEVYDSYLGDDYGIPTKECIDAIRLVAQTEGIFLDPVYTGKAMAGLIDLVKKRHFKSTDTIVFIHSGGVPLLFAYNQEIAR